MQKINVSAPNLINVCIDSTDENEKKGRMYCYYQEEAAEFRNIHELIRMMNELMNGLNYPQSSVEMRSYDKKKRVAPQKQKVALPDMKVRKKILEKRGKLDTLIVYVKYRQSATWQGSVYHIQNGVQEDFCSELELMKIIDNAEGKTKKFTKYV